MRPVAAKWEISQAFGSGATEGVGPGDPMWPYVQRYGNYQPYGHAGCDIACPVGTPVYAMAPGTVLWADWGTNLPGDDSGAGWASRWYLYKGFPGIVTVIQHPGWIGVYAHLSSNDAAPAGTVVREGDLIGLSGNTGGVDEHLHVEALINLSYVTQGGLIYGRTNPVPYWGTKVPGASIGTQSTTTKPVEQEDDDMPTPKRIPAIVRKKGATLLGGPGKPWYLKDAKGKTNLNVAQFGPGIYDGVLFVQGTGLPEGQFIKANFVVVTNGKKSGYWSQHAAHGTASGEFQGSAILSGLTVRKGQTVEVSVESSVKGVADLTTYGADLKLWQ